MAMLCTLCHQLATRYPQLQPFLIRNLKGHAPIHHLAENVSPV